MSDADAFNSNELAIALHFGLSIDVDSRFAFPGCQRKCTGPSPTLTPHITPGPIQKNFRAARRAIIDCSPRGGSRTQMRSKATALVLLLLAVLTGLAAAPVRAQQPQDGPKPSSAPASPTPSPLPAAGQQGVAGSETKPVYGVQGVLVETLDGRIVASQNPDQAFNPALSAKLATALIALRTFGAQHRFTTGIWTDGTLDKTSGSINGNLYFSGRDPSLHYEHASTSPGS